MKASLEIEKYGANTKARGADYFNSKNFIVFRFYLRLHFKWGPKVQIHSAAPHPGMWKGLINPLFSITSISLFPSHPWVGEDGRHKHVVKCKSWQVQVTAETHFVIVGILVVSKLFKSKRIILLSNKKRKNLVHSWTVVSVRNCGQIMVTQLVSCSGDDVDDIKC